MPENQRKLSVLAITGGIACGKSEVGRILEKMGFDLCDSDRVAHELMTQGTPVFRSLVDHFGTGVLSEAGEISRPKLAAEVFGNPERRQLLNKLVHPAVREKLSEWISAARSSGRRGAVQIPLLFESGMESWDFVAVICVSSDDTAVYARLDLRGFDRAEARRRIESQMPLAEKERRADCVIRNDGSLEELEEAVRYALNSLLVKGSYE